MLRKDLSVGGCDTLEGLSVPAALELSAHSRGLVGLELTEGELLDEQLRGAPVRGRGLVVHAASSSARLALSLRRRLRTPETDRPTVSATSCSVMPS